MGRDRAAVGDETTVLRLRESGCGVRAGRGGHGRRALEVYLGGRLYDVVVEGSLGSAPIRAAVRYSDRWRPGRWRPGQRRSWTLAWGELPSGCGEVTVVFGSRRVSLEGACTVVADRFWVAETAGLFNSVEMTGGGAAVRAAISARLGRRALGG